MFSVQDQVYRFEDIEVDSVSGRLTRGDELVHLRQKAFSVLVCLLENRERIITKDELFSQVWNGTAVVDDVLVQCIKDIRRALNDDPHRPRFVRTVPKYGYRFISPVIECDRKSITEVEEVTRVELEILEETSEQEKTFVAGLTRFVASRRVRLVLSAAAVVIVFAVAGLLYLAPVLFGANDSTRASAHNVTSDPDALRYYSLGVEKAQAVHNQEAIEYLQKAIEIDPEFAMAHARIGYVYALMWGQPDKGRPYLERANALSHRLSEIDKLHLAAWIAIADRDYPAAIPPLQEIIFRFPLESEAYWRLGRVLTGEGQHEEAVAVLRRGLAADPSAKNIYNLLGGITSSLGRHDESIALQQKYVELAPGEPNAYDSLGMAYQHAGRYADAAVQYQRALDLKPDFEVALAHYANTRFQQGRYNEAIDLYKKYLAAAPSEAEQARGYGRLSMIHSRRKDFVKADEAARSAEAYNREEFASLLLALDRNDFETAQSLEDSLLEMPRYASRGIRGDSRVKFYLRGLIGLKKGQLEEALENFRTTLKYLPPSWDLIDFEDSLAHAYLQIGQYDRSIAEYQRILLINPNYPLAHFRIAQAYDQLKQPGSAFENYTRFVEIWKDADADIPEVKTAKEYIRSFRY